MRETCFVWFHEGTWDCTTQVCRASKAVDLLQHLLDTIFGFSTDHGPGLRLEVQVAFQDAVKDLLLALTPEGGHTTEQDVQDHSTAPDVCLVAIVPPQHLQCTLQTV